MIFRWGSWTLQNILQSCLALLVVTSPGLVCGMAPAQLYAQYQYDNLMKVAVKPNAKSASNQCLKTIIQTFKHYPPSQDARSSKFDIDINQLM